MTTIANINPVDIITELAANQLTDSIVAAATSNKSRKSTKAVVETSLVDEIHALVQSNSLDEVAVENLSRVFGREFVLDAEPSLVDESKEPKEKKPRAKKVKITTATDDLLVAEAEPKAPKEKKSRSKKDAIEDATAASVPVEEPNAKKASKPKKVAATATEPEPETEPETATETATETKELPVEEPKAKKASKPKKVAAAAAEPAPAPETATETAPETKELPVEEPKAKKIGKTKKVVATAPETAAATKELPVEEPKAKKASKPKATVVNEKKTRNPKAERPSTPVLVEDPVIELTNPVRSDKVEEELDFSGFDAELVEEELSDIED